MPLIDPALRAAFASRLTLSDRPICPECLRFVPVELWDTHLATHHEERRGRAEEAACPPPVDEDGCTACRRGSGLHRKGCQREDV